MVLFVFFVAAFWIVVVIVAVFKAVKYYFGEYSILPQIHRLINVYLWACWCDKLASHVLHLKTLTTLPSEPSKIQA